MLDLNLRGPEVGIYSPLGELTELFDPILRAAASAEKPPRAADTWRELVADAEFSASR